MSLNTPLSKELRFIHSIFQIAASRSVYDGDTVEPESFVLAGGAIRDLYFDRSNVRDLDFYFDSCRIDPQQFASSIERMTRYSTEVDDMARQQGFSGAEVTRSLVPMYSSQDVQAYPTKGFSGGQISGSTPASWQSIPNSATRAPGSGSGSNVDPAGRAHPLQAVEEFYVRLDGVMYTIELMTVSMSPVDYIKTHFAVKLSRCYYDGSRVVYTPDFFQDARNKTITVACPINHARFERLFSYYLPKMQSYFPGFEIRIDLAQMNAPSPRFGRP